MSHITSEFKFVRGFGNRPILGNVNAPLRSISLERPQKGVFNINNGELMIPQGPQFFIGLKQLGLYLYNNQDWMSKSNVLDIWIVKHPEFYAKPFRPGTYYLLATNNPDFDPEVFRSKSTQIEIYSLHEDVVPINVESSPYIHTALKPRLSKVDVSCSEQFPSINDGRSGTPLTVFSSTTATTSDEKSQGQYKSRDEDDSGAREVIKLLSSNEMSIEQLGAALWAADLKEEQLQRLNTLSWHLSQVGYNIQHMVASTRQWTESNASESNHSETNSVKSESVL